MLSLLSVMGSMLAKFGEVAKIFCPTTQKISKMLCLWGGFDWESQGQGDSKAVRKTIKYFIAGQYVWGGGWWNTADSPI